MLVTSLINYNRFPIPPKADRQVVNDREEVF